MTKGNKMKRLYIQSIVIAVLFSIGMVGCNKGNISYDAEDIESIVATVEAQEDEKAEDKEQLSEKLENKDDNDISVTEINDNNEITNSNQNTSNFKSGYCKNKNYAYYISESIELN